VPTGLASATTQFIIAENLVYIALLRTTVGALSNIGLNVYLIPRYGPVGAAWATLISYSLVIVTLLAFRQTRQQGTGAVAAVMPGAMMGTVRELARSIGRNI
jgi:O-antigen/teichoic acid export membrane protein